MSFLITLLASLVALITAADGAASSSGARSTVATANIKHLVNAIESCAASRVDGGYTGPIKGDPGAPDCLDPQTLREYEPALVELGLTRTVPAADEYQVVAIGSDGFGYLVQAAVEHEDGLAYFAEAHEPDGALHKVCRTEPITPTDLTAGAASDAVGCDDGGW